ncbi:MAG: transposase [bacterium]
MAKLCSKKQPYSKKEKLPQTRYQIMIEMLQLLASWLPNRQIIHTVDGAYAHETIVNHLPANVEIVSQIRADAALYEKPSLETLKRRGAPHKKGNRLQKPKDIANDPQIPYQTIQANTYGESSTFLVKQITALWYRVGKSKPLSILIVRDPEGKHPDAFFFTTLLSLSPSMILELIAGRWSIEITHRDSKQYMGISEP